MFFLPIFECHPCRSPSRTQPNLATCVKANEIWKCVSKFRVNSSKTAYFQELLPQYISANICRTKLVTDKQKKRYLTMNGALQSPKIWCPQTGLKSTWDTQERKISNEELHVMHNIREKNYHHNYRYDYTTPTHRRTKHTAVVVTRTTKTTDPRILSFGTNDALEAMRPRRRSTSGVLDECQESCRPLAMQFVTPNGLVFSRDRSHVWKLRTVKFLWLYKTDRVFFLSKLPNRLSLQCVNCALLCSLLTIERAWSRDHATSLVTAVLPPPG